MIGVEGQYVVRFDLEGTQDFVRAEDIIDFTIIEEAGNVLPSFEFVLSVSDLDILYKLHEGNTLEVVMGAKQTDMSNISLVPLSRSIQKQGEGKYLVRLAGLCNSMKYILNCQTRAFSNQSGVAAITSIANTYFDIDSNATSRDTQTWIQPNCPDKKFVNNIWMHCNMGDSFLALGITSDGKFVIKDMLSLLASEPAWRLVDAPGGKANEIFYDPDFFVEGESGFLNKWAGYERIKSVYTLESGANASISPSIDTMLIEGTLERLADVGTRAAENGLLSDNVHSNYWSSYLRNLSYLAVFSSFKLYTSYQNVYHGMKILDLVYFADTMPVTHAALLSHSGHYIVTKISRSLTDQRFVTTCQLSRESSVLAE